MSWHGYNITWSKEFKDYAFYALIQSNEGEIASEWLFHLYCSPTEAELEDYELSALINQSKELKMIRKWFKYVQEANGHGDEYMHDFRRP